MNRRAILVLNLVLAVFFWRSVGRAEAELTGGRDEPAEPLSLWYREPARTWLEALPIGNGRLGARVFGRLTEERLQLNEGTLWAGGPYDPVNQEAVEALPETRSINGVPAQLRYGPAVHAVNLKRGQSLQWDGR